MVEVVSWLPITKGVGVWLDGPIIVSACLCVYVNLRRNNHKGILFFLFLEGPGRN